MPSMCMTPPEVAIMWPPKPATLETSSPRTTMFRESSPTSARSSSGLPAKVCDTPKCGWSSGACSVTTAPCTAAMYPSSAWPGS